ncbi:hypothetical protein [Pseudochrobactrum saccharolyticum]|uniref:Uncharacterized protein n=1 Tax=Pseudochrobactrum saccharolyticum TaxID=354352 RepID=A0A7W8AJD5_9HYPH|nr:hypothetical protein [Pseudochrobactrum saccharolyticum]MBB5091310.1 hypothetical protein [Pseudochrobactrum saccharolyticum]MDP8250775.1 hypothetical protein [Pseudochrobactrum saccharolyticum]MDP8250802.1 hypothetical protein [Pseudochrobactrum saccharolyticum]
MTVEASKLIREQIRQRSNPIDCPDTKLMEQLVEEANQRALKGQQHDK